MQLKPKGVEMKLEMKMSKRVIMKMSKRVIMKMSKRVIMKTRKGVIMKMRKRMDRGEKCQNCTILRKHEREDEGEGKGR